MFYSLKILTGIVSVAQTFWQDQGQDFILQFNTRTTFHILKTYQIWFRSENSFKSYCAHRQDRQTDETLTLQGHPGCLTPWDHFAF